MNSNLTDLELITTDESSKHVSIYKMNLFTEIQLKYLSLIILRV